MKELGKLVNQSLEVRGDIQQTMNTLLHQQVLNDVKNQSFDKALEIMTEISDAPVQDIKRSFLYKLQEHIDYMN